MSIEISKVVRIHVIELSIYLFIYEIQVVFKNGNCFCKNKEFSEEKPDYHDPEYVVTRDLQFISFSKYKF